MGDVSRVRNVLPDDTFLRFVKVILSAGGHVRREPLEVAGQMHARLMQYTMT